MNNNLKRSFHIDSNASTDQVFTLLDAMQSDNKDEIEKLVNDFDTECVAPEETELTENPGNMNALKLEVNIYVFDQRRTHTEQLETKLKEKNKPEQSTPITWKHNVSPHYPEYCFLEGSIANQFQKSASAFDIYEQIINLNLLIEILVQQINLYWPQNWMNFVTNA